MDMKTALDRSETENEIAADNKPPPPLKRSPSQQSNTSSSLEETFQMSRTNLSTLEFRRPFQKSTTSFSHLSFEDSFHKSKTKISTSSFEDAFQKSRTTFSTLAFDEPFPGTKLATRISYKQYKRRWIILFLFVFYSAANAMQWVQFSIINNIVKKYYNISDQLVDWTAMIYMVVYMPLIFPGSWFLDKVGLRITVLVGVFGTAIGSWIKVFAVAPDMFLLAFIGQTIVATSQVCILSLPSRIAAVWFGPHQVSSACSVGVFGNQLGIAIGFVLPPILVPNSDDMDQIGHDLKLMFYYVAGFCTLLTVLILLFFHDKPPTPPSPTQDEGLKDTQVSFMKSLKNLALNRDYMLLLLSYGMNVGVFYAISTLLNPVVLKYYPGHEVDAGRIGLSIVLAGMVGSVVSGVFMDKTHKFKETTLGIYALSMVGMWVFSFTLGTGTIVVVYITASFLGFAMTGYLPVGFEFAAELTFPEPEGTSSGLLNAAAQLVGTIFTMAYSEMFYTYGDYVANIVMSIMLVIGTIITAIIRPDLRRQAAQTTAPAIQNTPSGQTVPDGF